MTPVATSAALEPVMVAVEVDVDPADPVFAGHYPGFPILPGLFLVEHVNTAYRNHVVALGGPPVRPVALEKVRFLKPVYPGDRVRFDLTIEPVDGQFRCAAWASVDSERVAEIRLRYPDGNGGAR